MTRQFLTFDMHKCFLLLGSNQGDKEKLISLALETIGSRIGTITKTSSFYLSEPWGFSSNDAFVNAVAIVETKKTPQKILEIVLEIENMLGRIRYNKSGYQSRKIDIDILFYDDKIVAAENLIIPHPRLHQRRFCLEPLHQIAPDFVHPSIKKSITELLEICTDKLDIKKIDFCKSEKINHNLWL